MQKYTLMFRARFLLDFRLLLFVAILISACSSNETATETVEKPENLLSEEKMVDLVLETQLLEAKVIEAKIKDQDSAIQVYNQQEKLLFDEYGVDSAAYYESHAYYVQELEIFQRVMDSVVIRLDSMRKKEETPKTIQKKGEMTSEVF